jgi:hypothetical protein
MRARRPVAESAEALGKSDGAGGHIHNYLEGARFRSRVRASVEEAVPIVLSDRTKPAARQAV